MAATSSSSGVGAVGVGLGVGGGVAAGGSSSFARCASVTSTALVSLPARAATSWVMVRSVSPAMAYSTTFGTVKKPPAFLSDGSM